MPTAKNILRLAACALGASIGAVWLPVAMLGQAPHPAKPAGTRLPDMMPTQGRIVITAPLEPFYLGEEAILAVTLKGPPTRIVSTQQSTVDANDRSQSIQSSYAEAKLERREDGQTFVRVVPQHPGKLDIGVDAVFSDGGYDKASITVDVIARNPPVKIEGDFLLKGVYYILMDLTEQDRSKYLRLTATYAGVKDKLPIPPGQAQFKLAMPPDAPSIVFDPKTLQIKALHIGHALVETRYAGLSLRTCVLVRESRDGYDPSDCSELSADADKPAPAATAAPRKFESKLPYGPTDNRTGRFLADDRVDVMAPTQALHIAQDNPITFHTHGPAVARIDCHPLRQELPCYPWTGEWTGKRKQGGSPTDIPLLQSADGTATVNLFPTEFGSHEFTFSIFFVDGGVALKKMTAEVDAGSVRPKSIGQWCDRETPDKLLPLELVPPKDGHEDFRGKTTLVPSVCYDGVRGAASPPAKAVKYQIRTEGKEPPIELDPATGTVKALRPGQALVQQSFAGVTADTCVVVAPLEEPNASNCRQLRARYGTPLPPLKYPVKPPQTADDPERPQPGRIGGIGPTIEVDGKAPPLPSVDAITGARLSPDVRDRFNADARLNILTNGLVAELGQPTKLPVRLTGSAVLSVTIEQELVRYYPRLGPLPEEDSTYMEERNSDRIGRSADGSPYLHVVPLRTGTSEFRIAVLFSDGGVATRKVRLHVKFPAGIPPHLVNGLGDSMRDGAFEASTLHLTAAPPGSRNLFPFIYFDNSRLSVALNPAEVEYSLKSADTDPVVKLDAKTGTVTALRVGHAIVTARYADAQTETCVVVVKDLAEGDSSTCEELRAARPPPGPS